MPKILCGKISPNGEHCSLKHGHKGYHTVLPKISILKALEAIRNRGED